MAADCCGPAAETRSGGQGFTIAYCSGCVKKGFHLADSRLSGEKYKVFKIQHYSLFRSPADCDTVFVTRTICRPCLTARGVATTTSAFVTGYQGRTVPLNRLTTGNTLKKSIMKRPIFLVRRYSMHRNTAEQIRKEIHR